MLANLAGGNVIPHFTENQLSSTLPHPIHPFKEGLCGIRHLEWKASFKDELIHKNFTWTRLAKLMLTKWIQYNYPNLVSLQSMRFRQLLLQLLRNQNNFISSILYRHIIHLRRCKMNKTKMLCINTEPQNAATWRSFFYEHYKTCMNLMKLWMSPILHNLCWTQFTHPHKRRQGRGRQGYFS